MKDAIDAVIDGDDAQLLGLLGFPELPHLSRWLASADSRPAGDAGVAKIVGGMRVRAEFERWIA